MQDKKKRTHNKVRFGRRKGRGWRIKSTFHASTRPLQDGDGEHYSTSKFLLRHQQLGGGLVAGSPHPRVLRSVVHNSHTRFQTSSFLCTCREWSYCLLSWPPCFYADIPRFDSRAGRPRRGSARGWWCCACPGVVLAPVYSHVVAPTRAAVAAATTASKAILLSVSPPRCHYNDSSAQPRLCSLTACGRLLADHRFPEGTHDEEVREREERLGDAVEVVNVGQDLVVLRFGCNGKIWSSKQCRVRQYRRVERRMSNGVYLSGSFLPSKRAEIRYMIRVVVCLYGRSAEKRNSDVDSRG